MKEPKATGSAAAQLWERANCLSARIVEQRGRQLSAERRGSVEDFIARDDREGVKSFIGKL